MAWPVSGLRDDKRGGIDDGISMKVGRFGSLSVEAECTDESDRALDGLYD